MYFIYLFIIYLFKPVFFYQNIILNVFYLFVCLFICIFI